MEHEYTQQDGGVHSSKSTQPSCSFSDILNRMFKPGDRLQLYDGAEPYKEAGSFLAFTDDTLIWVDSKNNLSFQYIEGNLGIRKIDTSPDNSSEGQKSKLEKNKYIPLFTFKSIEESNEVVLEEVKKKLAEVEEKLSREND